MRGAKRSRIFTRAMTCLLAALVMITGLPASVSAYDAKSEPLFENTSFVDSMKLKNAKQRAMVEYIYADYSGGNDRYKGSGQCYGYAEKIRKMFGKKYKQRKYGVKATKANFYKKLKKLKPGTHVRLSAKKNGGGSAHSIVLLKITKNTIWYTDGNYDYNNGIRYSQEPLDYFCSRMMGGGRKYLAWAREPKGKIPEVKKVSVKSSADANGPDVHLAWRPVKKAKKYIVYRSTSKDSGYKKIATIKSCSYIDRSKNLYGKVYYKVTAVKSKGKTTSKPKLAKRKLKTPVVYLTEDNSSETPQLDLTWSAVPGAVKYKIYVWNESKDRAELIATVTDTAWRYTGEYNGYYIEFYVTAEAARAGSESFPALLCY